MKKQVNYLVSLILAFFVASCSDDVRVSPIGDTVPTLTRAEVLFRSPDGAKTIVRIKGGLADFQVVEIENLSPGNGLLKRATIQGPLLSTSSKIIFPPKAVPADITIERRGSDTLPKNIRENLSGIDSKTYVLLGENYDFKNVIYSSGIAGSSIHWISNEGASEEGALAEYNFTSPSRSTADPLPNNGLSGSSCQGKCHSPVTVGTAPAANLGVCNYTCTYKTVPHNVCGRIETWLALPITATSISEGTGQCADGAHCAPIALRHCPVPPNFGLFSKLKFTCIKPVCYRPLNGPNYWSPHGWKNLPTDQPTTDTNETDCLSHNPVEGCCETLAGAQSPKQYSWALNCPSGTFKNPLIDHPTCDRYSTATGCCYTNGNYSSGVASTLQACEATQTEHDFHLFNASLPNAAACSSPLSIGLCCQSAKAPGYRFWETFTNVCSDGETPLPGYSTKTACEDNSYNQNLGLCCRFHNETYNFLHWVSYPSYCGTDETPEIGVTSATACNDLHDQTGICCKDPSYPNIHQFNVGVSVCPAAGEIPIPGIGPNACAALNPKGLCCQDNNTSVDERKYSFLPDRISCDSGWSPEPITPNDELTCKGLENVCCKYQMGNGFMQKLWMRRNSCSEGPWGGSPGNETPDSKGNCHLSGICCSKPNMFGLLDFNFNTDPSGICNQGETRVSAYDEDPTGCQNQNGACCQFTGAGGYQKQRWFKIDECLHGTGEGMAFSGDLNGKSFMQCSEAIPTCCVSNDTQAKDKLYIWSLSGTCPASQTVGNFTRIFSPDLSFTSKEICEGNQKVCCQEEYFIPGDSSLPGGNIFNVWLSASQCVSETITDPTETVKITRTVVEGSKCDPDSIGHGGEPKPSVSPQ